MPTLTPRPSRALTEPADYLTLEDLLDLAGRLLGQPPPSRDVGLLGSAAARSQATAFGTDVYPDRWTKAAALLQSVVNNHALVDGNKRLGWLATATFLELNGVPASRISNNDVYRLVMDVASGHPEVEELAARLKKLATR